MQMKSLPRWAQRASKWVCLPSSLSWQATTRAMVSTSSNSCSYALLLVHYPPPLPSSKTQAFFTKGRESLCTTTKSDTLLTYKQCKNILSDCWFTKQNKTKQNKTKQNKTKQNKTNSPSKVSVPVEGSPAHWPLDSHPRSASWTGAWHIIIYSLVCDGDILLLFF